MVSDMERADDVSSAAARMVDAHLSADRPVVGSSNDLLGFAPSAGHMADVLLGLPSGDGFVVGIEGEWGAGKSSLLNLIEEQFRASKAEAKVVRFLPWLISSRDVLVKELLGEIVRCALELDEAKNGLNKWGRFTRWLGYGSPFVFDKRRKQLKKIYGDYSARLVSAAKVADLFGSYGAGAVATVGKGMVDSWIKTESLSKEKQLVQRELANVGSKIFVFIDDLDRLESAEVVEILRLVRAVVDFPNVVFVLCYSPSIIEGCINRALGVRRGLDYLEKIIQIRFSVPEPEAFDLRRMMGDSIKGVFPDVFLNEDVLSVGVRSRMAGVIDSEGQRALSTPRNVVRVLNSLRVHALPVLESIDLADMLWLQLIRLRSPDVYAWVDRYMREYAAMFDGAMVSSEIKRDFKSSLKSLLESLDDYPSGSFLQGLCDMLPGIHLDMVEGKSGYMELGKLFESLENGSLIDGKRLGSPVHYRFYFAQSAPKTGLADADFAAFMLDLNESATAASIRFLKLSERELFAGKSAALSLMERLQYKIDGLSQQQLVSTVLVLSECMDRLGGPRGSTGFAINWAWEDALKIFGRAWKRIDGAARREVVQSMFRTGSSIGWLTDLFRKETYSHGVYGNRAVDERERIFERAEYEFAASILIRRYEKIDNDFVSSVNRMAPILYAWLQYDARNEVTIRKKISDLCISDAGFLSLIDKLRSWERSNGDVSHPVRSAVLDDFMNAEGVERRLGDIWRRAESAHESEMAKQLLDSLTFGTEK